jgi:hypothetical protein
MTLSHRTILGLGTVAEAPFRAHATFANSEDHRMGISGAQSSGQRLQGLVPTTDISTCRIGDLASPTGRRTTRQNDGHRDPTSSAGTYACARVSQAGSTSGDAGYASNRCSGQSLGLGMVGEWRQKRRFLKVHLSLKPWRVSRRLNAFFGDGL